MFTRIALLAAAAGFFLGSTPSVAHEPETRNHILLWNKLDSISEVEQSTIGPGGMVSGGTFVPGVFGNAFLANPDEDGLVSFPVWSMLTHRGTIEFWARLMTPPTGPIGAGDRPRFVDLPWADSHYAIGFTADDGMGNAGLVGCAGAMSAVGFDQSPNVFTYADILGASGVMSWHHYALTWDDTVVPGLGQHTALYIDGVMVAKHWVDTLEHGFPPLEDGVIRLITNDNTQGSVLMDNLIVWDFAKSDFSDRFVETPRELLLWNRFDSPENVYASDVGPDFRQISYIYSDWQEAQIAPAKFDNGLFMNHDTSEGWANNGANFFAVDLWEMGLTPECGTIAFWFEFKYGCDSWNHAYFWDTSPEFVPHYPPPLPGVGTHINMAWDGWSGADRKRFSAAIGEPSTGISASAKSPPNSAGPGGYLAFQPGTLFHFAMAWDVAGIDGSLDTVRLYVNGVKEGATDLAWDSAIPFERFLYVGTHPNCDPWDHVYNAVKGVTDNVMIWNYAKTDFEDRFVEGPCPFGIPSDINHDGTTDILDLTLFLSHFGNCTTDPEFYPQADLDGRGCVDLADLTILLAQYGTICP